MDKLLKAINGTTVIVTYEEIKEDCPTLADLQSWCTTFGLTYTETTENGTTKYTIKKL